MVIYFLSGERKKNEFPNIANIARKILAIPAANTSVERLFSSTKITVGDRRTKLGAEKLDNLMFLQKNLRPLKNLFDSKNVLATQTKRKPGGEHTNDNGEFISKRVKFNEIDECELLSDSNESETQIY